MCFGQPHQKDPPTHLSLTHSFFFPSPLVRQLVDSNTKQKRLLAPKICWLAVSGRGRPYFQCLRQLAHPRTSHHHCSFSYLSQSSPPFQKAEPKIKYLDHQNKAINTQAPTHRNRDLCELVVMQEPVILSNRRRSGPHDAIHLRNLLGEQSP